MLQVLQYPMVTSNEMSRTFLNFAYGSNMLKKRIHYRNPTAKFKCIGKLKDHRLDFEQFDKAYSSWKGAAATIVPHPGFEVWGVVWELDSSNLDTLDDQEGVKDNVYFRKSVQIETEDCENLECAVYQLCDSPKDFCEPKKLPVERQPSYRYLEVMIVGAEDYKIPREYIEFIKSFAHNGIDFIADPKFFLAINIRLDLCFLSDVTVLHESLELGLLHHDDTTEDKKDITINITCN